LPIRLGELRAVSTRAKPFGLRWIQSSVERIRDLRMRTKSEHFGAMRVFKRLDPTTVGRSEACVAMQ
jgi:hypothetical protein